MSVTTENERDIVLPTRPFCVSVLLKIHKMPNLKGNISTISAAPDMKHIPADSYNFCLVFEYGIRSQNSHPEELSIHPSRIYNISLLSDKSPSSSETSHTQ